MVMVPMCDSRDCFWDFGTLIELEYNSAHHSIQRHAHMIAAIREKASQKGGLVETS